MKTKNFLVSGIAGGFTAFIVGWLLYGILFKDSFPQPAEDSNSMILIALGSLTFGLLIAYIFVKWAQISSVATGSKAGAIIALFLSLYYNFFNMAMSEEVTYQMFALDLALSIVMGAIVGAIIAMVNGKLG
ncbi:hypothetical protein [Confluentibacter flavum]|uniref:DUF1761 domain-containing protein n=1 Tax=Confluentibacter flavum TaxID=1909700 RepID=A0A2N3HN57_9FLAO|nr:hypothetical protein [Confluentibacter flavum]PKQ46375.1 hypothetical protein CSW08_04230 [Confluentibacter flavum]